MPLSLGAFASTIALRMRCARYQAVRYCTPRARASWLAEIPFFDSVISANGEKPLVEGQVGVMVDGARGRGELEAAVIALIELAVRSGLSSLPVGLALAGDPRYPLRFTG